MRALRIELIELLFKLFNVLVNVVTLSLSSMH
jgi:hypothetical protein